MAKYRSRATRLSDAMSEIEGVISTLEDIRDEEDIKADERVKKANDEISKISYSEVEDLQSEMESWRDNMSGTNLESTNKYSMVEECADYLSNVASTLQDISEVTDEDEIQEVIDNLQSAVDEASSVDFPGMFG